MANVLPPRLDALLSNPGVPLSRRHLEGLWDELERNTPPDLARWERKLVLSVAKAALARAPLAADACVLSAVSTLASDPQWACDMIMHEWTPLLVWIAQQGEAKESRRWAADAVESFVHLAAVAEEEEEEDDSPSPFTCLRGRWMLQTVARELDASEVSILETLAASSVMIREWCPGNPPWPSVLVADIHTPTRWCRTLSFNGMGETTPAFFESECSLGPSWGLPVAWCTRRLASLLLHVTTPSTRSTVHIGVGGGTLLAHLHSRLGSLEGHAAVDHHPALPRLARQWFGVPETVPFHTMDAREFLSIPPCRQLWRRDERVWVVDVRGVSKDGPRGSDAACSATVRAWFDPLVAPSGGGDEEEEAEEGGDGASAHPLVFLCHGGDESLELWLATWCNAVARWDSSDTLSWWKQPGAAEDCSIAPRMAREVKEEGEEKEEEEDGIWIGWVCPQGREVAPEREWIAWRDALHSVVQSCGGSLHA